MKTMRFPPRSWSLLRRRRRWSTRPSPTSRPPRLLGERASDDNFRLLELEGSPTVPVRSARASARPGLPSTARFVIDPS